MTLADWSRLVKNAEEWKCVLCGRENSKLRTLRLETHHIEKKSIHPEKTTDLNNGVTLCRICHRRIHGDNFLDNAYPAEFLKSEFAGEKMQFDFCAREYYDINAMRKKLKEYIVSRQIIDLSVPVDLHNAMVEYTSSTGETMNGFIKRAITEAIANKKGEP